jgi:hypothetical protein
MKQLGDNGILANRRVGPTTIALRIGALALIVAVVGCGSDSTPTKDAGNDDVAGSGGRDTGGAVGAGGAVGSGGAAGGAIGSSGEAAAGGGGGGGGAAGGPGGAAGAGGGRGGAAGVGAGGAAGVGAGGAGNAAGGRGGSAGAPAGGTGGGAAGGRGGSAGAPPGASLLGWQLTGTNVGLAPHGLSCDALPAYTGSLKPASGARISNVRISGPLDLSNGDIIVEKSCIRPTSVGYHNSFLVTTTICAGNGCSATPVGRVTVRDSEVDASGLSAATIATSCAFLGVGTVQRNYMHGMGSGICFFETGTEFDALAEQNYVTSLRSYADSHNEAATIRDFRKNTANTRTVKFVNNRLDCSSGNETGGLFIQPTWLPIYNVTVEGNYLEGGGYNLYLEATGNATYGNAHSNNNRFRSTGWGPSAVSSGPGWTTWSNNYRYDATRPDGKGAVVNP